VFRVDGKKYHYQARAVNMEHLDEVLIENLDEKYLGAIVQKVES
jgi:hypothetical protein